MVDGHPTMREYRERLRGIRQNLGLAKGYAKSYSKLVMNYDRIMKYRQFSGDRPGFNDPPAEDSEWGRRFRGGE
jgi:hypothetical protein